MQTILAVMIIRITIIYIFIAMFTPESPYFYFVTGKIDKCNLTLNYIANRCGIDDLPIVDKDDEPNL